MLRLGIVGLPNVGKSTLVNAPPRGARGKLSVHKEPNVGRVNVPNPRLDELTRIVEPQRTVRPPSSSWTRQRWARHRVKDSAIARQHPRDKDAIVHVVRAFDDHDVLHVMGTVAPCGTARSSSSSSRSPICPSWAAPRSQSAVEDRRQRFTRGAQPSSAECAGRVARL
jgi:hypothetical protein